MSERSHWAQAVGRPPVEAGAYHPAIPSGIVDGSEMSENLNVVARLKQRLNQARKAGFKVRMEVLEDEQATWCQVGTTRILFVNLSQTAAEQLAQVEETLREFAGSVKRSDSAASVVDVAAKTSNVSVAAAPKDVPADHAA
ncbi:hypothetical protein K227x_60520 [Rubripirellula lacrimiformis]|uniref:Uncharacterized protein n=1 Tax=Rubripirellula lacrimiformis TaxID=1930273 RepID=A0A517NKF0_9BACT|nr:hypothetical protein [Rubripirellula lacrimiformis]QDT07624.1 hypothetical protein K227x_60520 [Rubripirellula lacrimiformis]